MAVEETLAGLSNTLVYSAMTVYTGAIALALNLIVAIVVSVALRRRRGGFEDRTMPEDYLVEAGDPGVKDVEPTAPEQPTVPAGQR